MPGSVKDKVAIVGMGCTRFGELREKSPSDLNLKAVSDTLAGARMKAGDVSAPWSRTSVGLLSLESG